MELQVFRLGRKMMKVQRLDLMKYAFKERNVRQHHWKPFMKSWMAVPLKDQMALKTNVRIKAG